MIAEYDKKLLIQDLQKFQREYGRSPYSYEIKRKYGYWSLNIYIKTFGTWNNALIAADLPINQTKTKLTGNEICTICGSSKTHNWHHRCGKIICSNCYRHNRSFVKGVLNPNSATGIGVITEHVVSKVLNNVNKCNTLNSFHNKHDLISEIYGTINVKSSKLKHNNWRFILNKKSKSNYYVCIGFDEYRSNIERVWIIPNNSSIVAKTVIHISLQKIERAKQYEVDATPYNEVYQNLDIYSLPEFCNLKHEE